MGSSWVTPAKLSLPEPFVPGQGAPEVAARFDALLRYVSLQLGRQLGEDVTPVLSRRELAEPALRAQALVQAMSTDGKLQGAINIPTRSPHGCHRRPPSRPGDLAMSMLPLLGTADRQPSQLAVEAAAARARHDPVGAFVMHSRGPGTAELLRDVRAEPTLLVEGPKKELRSFRIALGHPWGSARPWPWDFIDSVEQAINTFMRRSCRITSLDRRTATSPRVT
jgi:hypothetical protein